MENVLTEWLATYYDEVEPLQFYREIFPVGTMQPSGVYLCGDILVDILLWSENYLKKQEKRCKMSNIFIDTLRPL